MEHPKVGEIWRHINSRNLYRVLGFNQHLMFRSVVLTSVQTKSIRIECDRGQRFWHAFEKASPITVELHKELK